MWFDDFELGQVIQAPARTITEADVSAFAGLSADFNPLHVNAEFARRTPFRQRIAHGLLIESVASGLAHQTGIFDGTISALAEVRVAFHKPVFFGSTIRLELGVLSKDPDPGPKRGTIELSTNIFDENDDLVADGAWKVVFLRRRKTPRA